VSGKRRGQRKTSALVVFKTHSTIAASGCASKKAAADATLRGRTSSARAAASAARREGWVGAA
jgi:hypothetical protein